MLDSFLRFSLEEPSDPEQTSISRDFKKFEVVTHNAVASVPGDGVRGSVSPLLTCSEDGRLRINFEFEILGMKVIALLKREFYRTRHEARIAEYRRILCYYQEVRSSTLRHVSCSQESIP